MSVVNKLFANLRENYSLIILTFRNSTSFMRNNISNKTKLYFWKNLQLLTTSVMLALLIFTVISSLKALTEHYEHAMLSKTFANPWLLFFLPIAGIAAIRFLRKVLFRGKPNKGIKEIYNTLAHRRNELPPYKIHSHYINGLLTVASGGSTGIEVSTVVSSAALGASFYKRRIVAKSHKTALVCAGVAAGVTTLFANPVAGLLFAIEVIARKRSRAVFIGSFSASLAAWLPGLLLPDHHLFQFKVSHWHYHAIPWFLALSICCAILAVYFTRILLFIKKAYSKKYSGSIYWMGGAILLGGLTLMLPQLYGDSYHAIPEILKLSERQVLVPQTLLLVGGLILIKPIAASLTLGIGGDGGVFAPSLIVGALLGLLFALLANHIFHADLIVSNFMLLGSAAMLSAAIFAPLTAIALGCGLATGGLALVFPAALMCYLSKYVARALFGYTVYSYQEKAIK